MSRLQELIDKLCPNGVEYKPIEELCKISRGRVMSKDYIKINNGDYPVYSSQTENNGELGKISTYDFDGEYITWTTDGANAGSVFYRNEKFSVTNVCGLLEVISKTILTKFLYYELSVEAVKYVNAGMGNPKLMSNVMARIRVAVPPLEVQREIVHILDDFTLLSAELSAELKARQKQYEYYRDKLLTFEEAESLHGYFYRQEIKWLKLKEICKSIKDGMHNLPKNTLDKSMYPILSAQNIFNGEINFDAKRYVDEETYIKENKRTNIEKGDVLLTIVATIGRIAVVKEKNKFLLQRSVCVLKPNELVNPYYLKFYLETNKIQNYMITNAHGSAQSGLYLNQVAEIIVPIPSMDIQNKIVTILTNFYKITHDISEGVKVR